ncbi:MAG: ABC transporter substrate-binding protein [Candidatus Desulfatibia sp.]|uniref:ABC transporter substrate-binding protein n=1 Tax=Candidatus Desulfatibia sp. TaxID=3101189 RepID=UPI002F30194A
MHKVFQHNTGFGRIAIIIIVTMVVTGLAVFFVLRGGKEETIKIGAVLSVSGPGETLGIEYTDGMLLAADGINARNGINGRKIELIIEDSKTDAQEGKKAFKRIEKEHHPLFYVSILSSVSMALAPLSEENKVVLVGLAVSTARFTENKKWVFRYFTNTEIEAQAIFSILKELKVKKLGIIYLNDEYGTSLFEIVKQRFETSGGIVESEAYETKEFNYIEQIVKLKDMEAIYFIGFVPHIKKAFKQLKELNFKGSILGSVGGSTPIVTSMPEANGAYIAAPIIYNPNYLFAKEAKEKYEVKYNKPFNMFAANGYDFIKFIAGLLKDKKISRESLQTLLEDGFMYPGVFGILDVKPGQHEIIFPLHPARISDGELKYLIINK